MLDGKMTQLDFDFSINNSSFTLLFNIDFFNLRINILKFPSFIGHMKKMHDEEEVAANALNLNPTRNKNNIELPLDDLVNIVIT